MIKIEYPATKKERDSLHDSYIKSFDIKNLNLQLRTFFATKSNLSKFKSYTASSILLLPIGKLIKLSLDLNSAMTTAQVQKLKLIFNYDGEDTRYTAKLQPTIADFFMNASALNISNCYFCNVDHIYSFSDVGDYQGAYDFYQRATLGELQKIKNIGKQAAIKIDGHRRAGGDLNNLPLSASQLQNLKSLDFISSKNHFTLDHMLDKATHPIAALSLYNFVPSCYSCNSKFKKKIELVKTVADEMISPTSAQYVFPSSVRFKIFFPLKPGSKYMNIKKLNDFVLSFEIDRNALVYEDYIAALKLRARYVFHKQEVLKLIDKRKRYSESQLKEIAKITGNAINQVRKDIFGEELFESSISGPLSKLKRDISKEIGITK
ncbi:hypothetical protein LZZ85_00705 [Terrimonas sp. NA20]|uniref:Uncharacterized protein n=1 Tax=Terrimonas ginsenosidimutans TaxID=2908004 RepID=A0ABS9KKC0_9BACT|nr:hypothetical protein [Terrimonas ginsenosidimutans]MCG2612770.1 hypothetical protein [Terrimonas ginsenosidimutans]